MSDQQNLISLRDIVFQHDAETTVLDHVNLSVKRGERIGLVGSIGSGKTTLLHLIVGLLRPASGEVVVFGESRRLEQEFWAVRERVGLLFQDSEDQLFCPTVSEDIAFGPLNQGRSPSEALAAAKRALSMVGLDGFGERITHHLSGGEKRLVALATLLAMEPDALLLDEPENGLDPDAYQRVVDLLGGLPTAMVIVSHNIEFLRSVTDRLMCLEEGRLVEHA